VNHPVTKYLSVTPEILSYAEEQLCKKSLNDDGISPAVSNLLYRYVSKE